MFKTKLYVMRWIITLLFTAALAGTAQAAPPPHAGGPNKAHKANGQSKHAGKPAKNHSVAPSHRGDGRGDLDVDIFFGDRQRDIIRDYYGNQFSGGHCPPGLAKKNNGCLPPGQANRQATDMRAMTSRAARHARRASPRKIMAACHPARPRNGVLVIPCQAM